MSLEELKKYLCIDCDEDDDLLLSLLEAAEEYLTNAGVKKDYRKKLYSLAVKLLVKNWYDDEESISIGNKNDKAKFALNSIITQLKYCGDNNV